MLVINGEKVITTLLFRKSVLVKRSPRTLSSLYEIQTLPCHYKYPPVLMTSRVNKRREKTGLHKRTSVQ